MSTYITVMPEIFKHALRRAQATNPRVKGSTTDVSNIPNTGTFRVTDKWDRGYRISPDGELTGVFSLVPNQGNALVADAIANGATHLDCFDGYLVSLYARHGFTEARREPNWTDGLPDVVYMTLED